MEYDWATEVNIPRFILMLPDSFLIPGNLRDGDEAYQRQNAFRARLKEALVVEEVKAVSLGMIAADCVRTVSAHIITSDLFLRFHPNIVGIRVTDTKRASIASLKAAVDQLIADDLINTENALRNPELVDISKLPDALAKRALTLESESESGISSGNSLKSANYYRAAGALAFHIDTSRSLSLYTKAAQLDPNSTEAWHKCGELLSRLGKHNDAIQCYEKSRDLALARNDFVWLASSYAGLGRIYQSLGDLEKSAVALQLAVDTSQGRPTAAEVWARIVLGLAYVDILLGNSRAAKDKFESIVSSSEKVDRMEIMAIASNGLGFIKWAQGDSNLARRAFEDALEISRDLDLHEEIAKSRAGIGLLEFTAGRIDESRRHLTYALEVGRKIESAEIEVYTVYGLGLIEWARGDLDRSQEYFNRACQLGGRLKIPQIIAGCCNGQALLWWIRGDLAKAEEQFAKASEISQKIGFKNGLATAWNGLGLVKFACGDIEFSEQAFNNARALGQELDAPQIRLAADNGLGIVHLEKGQDFLAEMFFNRARRTCEEIGLVAGVGVALNGLGMVYVRRGLLDKAWECFRSAADLSREHKFDVIETGALVGFGWVNKGRGAIAAAYADWSKALDFYRSKGLTHFASKVEYWIANELEEGEKQAPEDVQD